jgi:hypothetical protein
MKACGYETFLMHQLATTMGFIDREVECDLAWETATAMYREFFMSDFNNSNKGLYECIVEFLNHKHVELAETEKVANILFSSESEEQLKREFDGE